MKQRSTTPVSKLSFAARACIIAASIMTLTVAPFTTQPAKADQYDDQIAAIQQQINQYEAAAGQLQAQANDLQQKVTALSLEKAHIQAQVDMNQAKYDQLQAQIAQTEKDIQTNKDVLGDTLADLYVEGDISPLEMLASSKNIDEYVNKQQYQQSIRDQLSQTIKRIQDLKIKLEQQKRDVERVLAQQKIDRDALAAKEAEQQQLLDQTKGEQSAYQALSAKSREEQGRIRAAQQAAIAAAIAASGGARLVAGGADGDYPWGSWNCPMSGYYSTGGADGNGGDGHGYGCRQCASYAAWRVAKEIGMYPNNWGNARDFPASARGIFQTGYEPRAGSLGVMGPFSSGAPEGHVVWVEAVSGGQVLVSQYNYDYGAGYGMYSKMWLSASIFDYGFIYIK